MGKNGKIFLAVAVVVLLLVAAFAFTNRQEKKTGVEAVMETVLEEAERAGASKQETDAVRDAMEAGKNIVEELQTETQ